MTILGTIFKVKSVTPFLVHILVTSPPRLTQAEDGWKITQIWFVFVSKLSQYLSLILLSVNDDILIYQRNNVMGLFLMKSMSTVQETNIGT